MAKQFISEPLQPSPGSFDAWAMARGEPGLPRQFNWRDKSLQFDFVLQTWVTSTPECRGGES